MKKIKSIMERIPCKFGRHIKGNPALFRWREDTFTGEIEALYHCKKCSEIMHYPLSLNLKEQERYDKWLEEQKDDNQDK